MDPPALAPRWHTALLIALVVSVAGTGVFLSSGTGAPSTEFRGSRIGAVYVPLIVVQAGLLFYVARVGRRHSALPGLVRRRRDTVGRVLADVILAAALFVLVNAVEAGWSSALGVVQKAPALGILPETTPERVVWVIVACAVGFGEEVVYRGYLTTQLSAFSGSVIAGVVLQALLFGIAHADQGRAAVIRLALYGVAFGVVARVRKSLLPVILCHVAVDLASGLLHG
jgi:membrane protease YdiL (CAAX protease family)